MSAALEQGVRERLRQIGAALPPPRDPRRLFYLLEVTSACDLACPVCYADAVPGRGHHEPVDRILRLGRKVLADGGRFVELIGGEPADHPELPRIVRELHRLGLRPVLTTNGLRLGQDPAFAAGLRRAGLHKASIQFDTLDAAASIELRGRDLVALKRAAVARSIAAGLRVGLIATMCDRNVGETGELVRFALNGGPRLNSVTLQCMLPTGRFPAKLHPVGREAILRSLLSSPAAAKMGLSAVDIVPPPQYGPWRALTHPACCSLLLLCPNTREGTVHPFGRDVDLERFAELLRAQGSRRDGAVNAVLRPLAALWRSARPGRRIKTMRRVFNLARGRGDGVCTITVDGDLHQQDWAADRVRRCPACFVTDEGFVSTGSRLCAVCRERNAAVPAP